MGGGSSRDDNFLGDQKELDILAKKAKKALEGGERKNTFLSFDSDDIKEVNLLRGQAKNDRSDIELIDWSVKEPYDSVDAKYIKSKISARIRQCSDTLVFVSKNTYKSKWVNWEVKKSMELGNSVTAIYSGSTKPVNLPSEIKQNDIPVMSWSDYAKKS